MEFVDVILIVMYLTLASSLVVVVWSKMRTWLKTVLVSAVLAIFVSILVVVLPDILESEDDETLWYNVADIFLVLLVISLLATCGVVLWSIVRRK